MEKGFEFGEVRDAIVRAFNPGEFDMFLYEQLDFQRTEYVSEGPFRIVVWNVLKALEDIGRVPELIAAVAAVRPLKPDVQEVYRKYARALIGEANAQKIDAKQLHELERYGLAPTVDVQRRGRAQNPLPVLPSHEVFERQIRKDLPSIDPRVWAAQMFRHDMRICIVQVDQSPRGTGFLVGPDAVLTNFHVLKDEIEVLNDEVRPKVAADRITFLFDYRVLANGVESEGTRVEAASDWLIDASQPLSDPEEIAGKPEPTGDQLDYAVVRLARRFGDEPTARGSPARGWIRVPATAPTITEGMGLMILQHPNTGPVKLAFDTESVISVNAARTRVRYATNTDPGSSGSPCFSLTWGLVAVHHLGEPGTKTVSGFNQGIPIAAIRDRLTRRHKADVLGPEQSDSASAESVSHAEPSLPPANVGGEIGVRGIGEVGFTSSFGGPPVERRPKAELSGNILALSGGGFRATLFHLGVIRYLFEQRKLQNVDTICSVSGGSVLAHKQAYPDCC
jgi:hypothetical protein